MWKNQNFAIAIMDFKTVFLLVIPQIWIMYHTGYGKVIAELRYTEHNNSSIDLNSNVIFPPDLLTYSIYLFFNSLFQYGLLDFNSLDFKRVQVDDRLLNAFTC